MSITFEVIDLSCEQADQSFFPPLITMQTKSTTSFAIMRGYREFIPSVPPKTYRKVTLSGVSERVGFTTEQTPRMCAGARYEYTGFGEINLAGVQTASYSKKFFAQCPKQYWPVVPGIQLNPFASLPSGGSGGGDETFVGYCWPPDLSSCQVCDPDLVNWPLLGDVTTNNLQLDLQGFRTHPNDVAVTSTSFSVSSSYSAITAIDAPTHQAFGTGNVYTVTAGALTLNAEETLTIPPLAFPVVFVEHVSGAYINWTDASNYSALLEEEYTDADALANAEVHLGTGATASTVPRTTGYVSVFTSVVLTLSMSNLIDGKDYLVEVDMWDKGTSPVTSVHTPKQYGFTASGTTHQITDVVATPAPFHTITVQKPTITFSPPP